MGKGVVKNKNNRFNEEKKNNCLAVSMLHTFVDLLLFL